MKPLALDQDATAGPGVRLAGQDLGPGERAHSLLKAQGLKGLKACSLKRIAVGINTDMTKRKVFVLDVPVIGDDVHGAAHRVLLIERGDGGCGVSDGGSIDEGGPVLLPAGMAHAHDPSTAGPS